MTIFYKFENKIYVNITNKCPCSCVFCIRKNSDSIVGNDSLWLEHEPTYEEIISAFENFNKENMSEIVFCGYGEPMMRADMLVKVAKYIKDNTDMKVRVNTNGLVKLMNPDFDINDLKGIVDSFSISLNAPDAEKYNDITKPCYGSVAFKAMLDFANSVKEFTASVGFTVVDIISEEDINICKELSEKAGIPLRVRHYVTDNESYT